MLKSAGTTFDTTDVPPEFRKKWDRLQSLNEDHTEQTGIDARQQQIDARYSWHAVEAMCDNLELNILQRSAVHKLHDRLDRQKFGKPLEVVIFCAAAYVVNDDPRSERKWHPNTGFASRDKQFNAVCERVSESYGQYPRKTIEKTFFQLAYKYRSVWKIDLAKLMDGDIPDNPSMRDKSEFISGLGEREEGGRQHPRS
ncbi:hypothetical protein [Natronococcus pandeyae]|nr:hypothetical protein [Natronococcus pandeyae]